MLKCKVCGNEFAPTTAKHYISRNVGLTGIAVDFQSTEEDKLFDSFDCPECGCQYVAQERKRNLYFFCRRG